MPKITVVVPVFKVEQYIDVCVKSILAQCFLDFELVLVNDGSPDACPALCDAWAKKDARIVVVHQTNKGAFQARNTGIRAAKGEWIAFVDGDDWIAPTLLQTLYDTARRTQADFVQVDVVQVGKRRRVEPHIVEKIYEKEELKQRVFPQYQQAEQRTGVTPSACGKLYRAALLKSLPLLIEKPVPCYYEDYLLNLFVIGKSDKIVLCAGVPLYHYRMNAQSSSHHYIQQSEEEIESFARAHLAIIRYHSDLPQRTEQDVLQERRMCLLLLRLTTCGHVFANYQYIKQFQRQTIAKESLRDYAQKMGHGYRLLLLCVLGRANALAVLLGYGAWLKNQFNTI